MGTKLQKHSQLNHPALKLGTTHTPLRARGPTTNHSRRVPQYMKHCLTHVHTTVHLDPPFIYHTPSRPFFLPLLYAVETSSRTCSRTCCSCMLAHVCPCSTRTTLCRCYISIVPPPSHCQPQLTHPHLKLDPYHHLSTISPHPPSSRCIAPLRAPDVHG